MCETDTFVTGFGIEFRPHYAAGTDHSIESNAGVLSLATRCSKINDANSAKWFLNYDYTTTETYASD